VNTLSSIVGYGIAMALIAYPLMYYALANRYKATLSNGINLCLFLVVVPIVGVFEFAFGSDTLSLSGLAVFFGVPLLVCFITIGIAFERRADRPKVRPDESPAPSLLASHLNRFSRPSERAAFVFFFLGIGLLLIGLVGYWVSRGFYWDGLKYYLQEIFLDDIHYRRGWSQWCARIGLALSVVGYVVAYHYDQTAGKMFRLVNVFTHWLRTGK
jgi:hypothetical protein